MRYANGQITKRFTVTGTSGDGSPVLSEESMPVAIPCSFRDPSHRLEAALAAKGVTGAQTITVESNRLTVAGAPKPSVDDRIVANRDGAPAVAYVIVDVAADVFGDSPGASNHTTLAVVLDADQSEAQA